MQRSGPVKESSAGVETNKDAPILPPEDSAEAQMPKLKVIKPFTMEQTRDFEEGKYLPFAGEALIMVEGEVVCSFDDLIRVAGEDRNRGKDFLEVRFMNVVGGG